MDAGTLILRYVRDHDGHAPDEDVQMTITIQRETIDGLTDPFRSFLHALGYPMSLIDQYITSEENETPEEALRRLQNAPPPTNERWSLTPAGEEWLNRVQERANEGRKPAEAWPFPTAPLPALEADAAECGGCAPTIHFDPAREG
jgi:hypothetical protein